MSRLRDALDAVVARPERLLPVVCVLAAGLLAISELSVTFEFTPPGGEPIEESLASDRHGYAMLVIAGFAIAATVLAISAGSKPAARAVAVAGAIALLIFLLLDLPDVNKIGTLDDRRQSFIDAKAVPQPGFWLELAASLTLALAGAALATLSSGQLHSLNRGSGPPGDRPGVQDWQQKPDQGKQAPPATMRRRA